jgi:hypothetical protein
MVFKIEYLRDGTILAAIEFSGNPEGARDAAALGICRYQAKAARILAANGDLVALVEAKQDA